MGNYHSCGHLVGKRRIDNHPAEAVGRAEVGLWEVGSVHGRGRDSIATIVDRKTGYVIIGKLKARTSAVMNERLRKLMEQCSEPIPEDHCRQQLRVSRIP